MKFFKMVIILFFYCTSYIGNEVNAEWQKGEKIYLGNPINSAFIECLVPLYSYRCVE